MLGYLSVVATSSKARVQAYRLRRKRGVRTVRIQFDAQQIAALIKKSYLDEPKRSDDQALQQAAQMLLSDALLGTILI
jgi:hypothetical protein